MQFISSKRYCLILLVALTNVFFLSPAEAFVFRTNYYCAPVTGQILFDGKPLADVKIERTLNAEGLKDGKQVDTIVTDGQGFFEMPEVSNKTFLFRPQFFSAAPGSSRMVVAWYQGEEYVLWASTKSGFLQKEEDYGTGIQIICDLTNSEFIDRFEYFSTKCNVQGVED